MHIHDCLSLMCMSFLSWTRRSFLRDDRGATAIEYGLIVGLISIVVLVAMTAIGSTVRDDIFNAVSTALQNVLPADS
ncbi:Flp family type IVb pilin [Roseibium sediminicola]|uniref:Flp family type IVb pilin n=1 Tax=Roseibium sediminicola TaxID=2933272 RepID=A0ABT0GUL3_9HYPH|nr:Flp family type IVb pilin [Roseibium sp. CAU 1639]MCK7612523.1 Flp family type IVb pilin [Roseibium sp. CAU 1639]